MTLYKRSLESQQELRHKLDAMGKPTEGPAVLSQRGELQALLNSAVWLSADIAKMKAKAQETDPDKQVYGKGMKAKILTLAADQDALSADLESRHAALVPLADAEQHRQAEAAATAERELADQKRRNEQAAAKQREDEAQRQQAQQAAAAETARLETARLQEAERKRRADLAAAQQAAREKAEAARAESERLAKERQAEILKKQEADLKARQEAQRAAAAATAAARRAEPPAPPFNAAGDVIHLHGGQSELDDILRKAGDRQLVVLDFSASWCGPCRMMEPVLVAWGQELAPRVIFIKCDAEEAGNRALAASSRINAFPTFHIYRGRMVGEIRGADRAGLRRMIDAECRLLAPLDRAPAAAVGPAVRLANAMSAMKAKVPPAGFQRAAETLLAYVRNLVEHPQEPKYRRIKAGNARYKSAVGSQPHGTECMAALGFQPIMEASEEILVLEEPSPELPRVKTLLEQAMAMSRRDAGAVASAGAAAAARFAAASPPAAAAPPAAASSAAPAAQGDVDAQARLMAQQLAAMLGGAGGPASGTREAAAAVVPGSGATSGSGASAAGGGGTTGNDSSAGPEGGDPEEDDEVKQALRDSMKDGGSGDK